MKRPPETAANALGAYRFARIVPMLRQTPFDIKASGEIGEYLLAKFHTLAEVEQLSQETIDHMLAEVEEEIAAAGRRIAGRN